MDPAPAELAVYGATNYAKLIAQATKAVNQLNHLRIQVTQRQQLISSLNVASGRGRTKTGQLSAYARDDRPWEERGRLAWPTSMPRIARSNIKRRSCLPWSQ